MSDLPIVETISGPIATLKFNRSAARNVLSRETLDQLATIIHRYEIEESLRVVILTGADDVFLSGANIRQLSTLDRHSAEGFASHGQLITQAIATLPQITIAAINGYCMGGGLDFALACDVRIASTKAVFAHPGARLGIITGWGGTQRLARLIGRSRALEVFLTARRLSGEEALQIGLINKIADPALDAAISLAKTIVATS